MGVGSYLRLGQAEDPDFKLMVVRTLWPGASAEEVERQLTDKLEKKLQENTASSCAATRSGESPWCSCS